MKYTDKETKTHRTLASTRHDARERRRRQPANEDLQLPIWGLRIVDLLLASGSCHTGLVYKSNGQEFSLFFMEVIAPADIGYLVYTYHDLCYT